MLHCVFLVTAECKREASKLSTAAMYFKVCKQLQALQLLNACQKGTVDITLFSNEAPWADAQAAIAAVLQLAAPLQLELGKLRRLLAIHSEHGEHVEQAAAEPFNAAVNALAGSVQGMLTSLQQPCNEQVDVVAGGMAKINSSIVDVVLAAASLGSHAADTLMGELAESALQAMELVIMSC
jgi:hypothetical protein